MHCFSFKVFFCVYYAVEYYTEGGDVLLFFKASFLFLSRKPFAFLILKNELVVLMSKLSYD